MTRLFKKKSSIWFWQQMVTPHMSELAVALTKRGFKVNYVASEILSKKRIQQGWKRPKLGRVKLLLAPNKDKMIAYARNSPNNSIHLSEGLRGNGLVGYAQKIIRKRGQTHWAMMEQIEDQNWKGYIKRLIYRLIILYWRNHLEGIMAIGRDSLDWYVKHGMQRNRVISFAYFIKKPNIKRLLKLSKRSQKKPFRFIFVGSLIKLKRVDILIKAIAKLKHNNIELWIVGNGNEKKHLQSLANQLLPQKKLRWFGVVSSDKIQNMIYKCDCLVLPSYYDGWGAVVSESLMVGTPVICSDKCGSSEVVKVSKAGNVFPANNEKELIKCLLDQIIKGHNTLKERKKIMKWAKCLGADAGAEYLEKVLFQNNRSKCIKLPWK